MEDEQRIIALMYFQVKYYGTKAIWQIWVFWVLCVFQPILGGLESRYDVVNGISTFVKYAIQFLFFFYFFVVDTVHVDSLKMLLWNNLNYDPVTGRVYRTPQSQISWDKLKQLSFAVLTLVAGAMLMLMMVSKIADFFTPKPPAGSGKGSSGGESVEGHKPDNQKAIEEVFKKNSMAVFFSSVIVAPIMEEWIYRRFLMKAGQYKWWTITVSGFIFGLIHLRAGEGIISIIPYIMPGLVFAVGMMISKNIWHTLLAHGIYNTITLIHMAFKSK